MSYVRGSHVEWQAYNASNGRIFKQWRIRDERGRTIAAVADIDDSDRARAQTMAGAAALLAAVKSLLNCHTMPADSSWQTREIRDKAFRALAAVVHTIES